jgi:tRNA (guanine-N7-)-methyltransferase
MAALEYGAHPGLFGRRKGHRLGPRQQHLVESLLPQLALDLRRPAPEQPATLFAVPVDEVRLEIGFGGGEHLVAEAVRHRRAGFLGCEPFVNGIAKVLSRIDALGLRNIRLHPGDALDVIEWLPSASLSGIDMLYPDPWPKRRHWKRRFISDASLAAIARVLKPGAVFRLATDSAAYAVWALLRFPRSSTFEWMAQCADDWRQPWPGFPGTRYQAKAKRQGRASSYFVFRRTQYGTND